MREAGALQEDGADGLRGRGEGCPGLLLRALPRGLALHGLSLACRTIFVVGQCDRLGGGVGWCVLEAVGI